MRFDAGLHGRVVDFAAQNDTISSLFPYYKLHLCAFAKIRMCIKKRISEAVTLSDTIQTVITYID